jgi:hypothetical protein
MMQTVVIYGISLALSSVGASLQSCPDLQVLPVDPSMPDLKLYLGAVQPDAIIFDLAVSQPEWLLALWKEQPHLLLIGVDMVKGQAQMFSSQPAQVFTTGNLLQVIAGHAGNDPEPPDQLVPARRSKRK